MPNLSRLSIKSALHMARTKVRVAPDGGGWSVRVYWQPQAATVHHVTTRAELRVRRREMYVFSALTLLGVESDEALPAAMKAAVSTKPWRDEVASFMEKRALTGA